MKEFIEFIRNLLFEHNQKNKNKGEHDQYAKHLEYPKGSIVDLIEKTANKYPGFIAYEYYGTRCTYKKFMDKVNDTARALKCLGVKEGDRVTICMPNTPQAIIMFYAVNMVGAIANMVHPLSSEKEIELYLNISKSKYILTIDISYERVMKAIKNIKVKKVIVASPAIDMNRLMRFLYWFKKGKTIKIDKDNDLVMTWQQFIEDGYFFRESYRVKRNAKDPAAILYSGGTTGKPKGILLSNLNINALALQAHERCDPSNPGDSILAIMPIFHCFGLSVCIHTPLYIGMKCILIPNFNAKKFASLIKKHRPNFLVGVPTLFEALLKAKLRKTDLSCLKVVVSGGDSLTPTLKAKTDQYLKEHGSKARVREGYGLTESSGASCLMPRNVYKESSIGLPFPDTTYKIVRIGTTEEMPLMEEGEICINGPTVMMGYVDDQKETIQTLKTHADGKVWLHTGDIGYMDEEGFVYFRQRLKRVIISSGYNIYPTYIENVINSHEAVLTSTVIGVDHPYKVQVAKAFIVLKDGVKPTKEVEKSIKEHCEKNIAKYAMPYKFEFRTSLPKTLVGKVAYRELEKEEKEKQEQKTENIEEQEKSEQ